MTHPQHITLDDPIAIAIPPGCGRDRKLALIERVMRGGKPRNETPGRCPLSGTRPTVRALGYLARNGRRKCGERPMRDLAAAADRIDYWIRRHVIVSCYGTHPPSQSKLNSARDRRVGLSAIGQCLKDQYDALATPIPPHLAALVKQLETQK